MTYALLSVVVVLAAVAAYALWANRKNHNTALRLQGYVGQFEPALDELHDRIKLLRREVQAGERVITHQLDQINNLNQANIQLMYIVDPGGDKALISIPSGFDA